MQQRHQKSIEEDLQRCFFPQNKKVGSPNDTLQNVCSAEAKERQITVITKKENNVVNHTILPKFEINGSIKILNEKLQLPSGDEPLKLPQSTKRKAPYFSN